MATIQILAGKNPITSAQYNSTIASTSSTYVQFPAAVHGGWVALKASSNNPQLWAADYTISFSGYTSGYLIYLINASDTFVVSNIGLSTPAYYSSGKLYEDNAYTNYVPDGYYRLPSMFTQFERDNYFALIQNGVVVGTYGGD